MRRTTKAVKAVLAGIASCWPNTKIDERDTTGVWGNALAGLSNDQIKAGIAALSRSTKEFPPTPGQFRATCVVKDSSHADFDADLHRHWLALCEIIEGRLYGYAPPDRGQTFRFNLRDYAERIVDGVSAEPDRSEHSMRSACFGQARVDLLAAWARP